MIADVAFAFHWSYDTLIGFEENELKEWGLRAKVRLKKFYGIKDKDD